jgi:hypothetical protein
MNWYSAHIVMYVEFQGAHQGRFPVWENIILIEAKTEDDAFEKAEEYGRSEEGDDGGSFRWENQPARWVFAGVRKLTECQNVAERPGDGTEVSYNEFELDSREAVQALAAGRPVQAHLNDRYRPAETKSHDTEGGSGRGKRRRA